MTRKFEVGMRESLLTLDSSKYSSRQIVEVLVARHITVSKTAVNDVIKKFQGKIRLGGGCTQVEDLRQPSSVSELSREMSRKPSPDATRTPKMPLLGSTESHRPPLNALTLKICRGSCGKRAASVLCRIAGSKGFK